MKLNIPDALKSELPHTTFGKVLGITPVVMTVVATLLAGLASSEMTRAQYARATAAQQQSKAGDQWSFFQAKRLRSALQRSSVDLLQSTALLRPVSQQLILDTLNTIPLWKQRLDSEVGRTALQTLELGTPPKIASRFELAEPIQNVLKEMDKAETSSDLKPQLQAMDSRLIEAQLKSAKQAVQTIEHSLSPVTELIEELEKAFTEKEGINRLAPSQPSLARDITAARMRYNVNRYDLEARSNQVVAHIHEVQVRKSNVEAERHHRRSQRFFFGMLAAQAAVILATFSLAASNKNLMWGIAAVAGLVAVGFAIYVFLYV